MHVYPVLVNQNMNERGGDRKQNYKNKKVILKQQGNSKEYRISKLKRDHPQVEKIKFTEKIV